MEPSTLERMTATLFHRGPDDAGLHIEPGVGLGFRRLSIIDVAGSHQPIGSEDGAIRVVCNGEIYNFKELRRTLTDLGHSFRTEGDVETAVHAYEQWGPDFLARLRGMFALALWDSRRRELLLARDRFGIKPLYYAETDRGLVFGSELKAVQAADLARRELDPEAIDLYLSLMVIPSPGSVFKAIRKLPPATLLRFGDHGMRLDRYWRPPLPSAASDGVDPRETAERLLAALRESVLLHLQSDVPLGFFLSGGMDSSALVALAAEIAGPGLKTFTVGFDTPGYDETAYARAVARAFGCDHHETAVAPDAAAILPRLVQHFGEPFADSSAVPTYHVCRAAAGRVKVVVGGDGGDELFAGYSWTRRQRFIDHWNLLPAPLRAGMRRALAGARGRPGRLGGLARFADDAARPPLEGYCRRMACLSPTLKSRLYTSSWRAGLRSRDAVFDVMAPFFADGVDPVDAMNRADLGIYLPDDDLCKVDRLTMLFSLEGRVPLLDNAVADVALSLPMDLKLRGTVTKYILKQAVGPLLPPAIAKQRKQGFAIPVASWMRGDLYSSTRAMLLSDRACDRGVFEPGVVDELLQAHRSGRADHGHALWALLVLELWFRLHMDHDRPRGAAEMALKDLPP